MSAVLAGLTWAHARDFRDARTLYESTLRGNPASWFAHSNLAAIEVASDEADVRRTEWHTHEAIRFGPADLVQAHYNLAISLDRQWRPLEALTDTTRSCASLSERNTAGRRVGLTLRHEASLLIELGEFERATEVARRGDGRRTASVDAMVLLSRALGAAGDSVGATHVIELLPDISSRPVAHADLGSTLFEQGRLSEAEGQHGAALAAGSDGEYGL